MGRRKFDPERDNVIFRYSMETFVGNMEPENYINNIHIDIIGQTEDGIEYKMGEAKRKIILLSAVYNDRANAYDVFDSSSELMEIGDLIYDFDNNEIKSKIANHFEIVYNDICVFERLCILPEYRGLGLAKKLVKDNVMRIGNNVGLIVMKPFPLQCEPQAKRSYDDNDENAFEKDMKYDELEQNPEKAMKSLKKYYKTFGYLTIRGIKDLMFLVPAFINEKLEQINMSEF
jgi:GNAT superfamily N-acetyltransferase